MSSHAITLAGNFTFSQWVKELSNSLNNFNIPLVYLEENRWKEWVYNFISLNPGSTVPLPSQDNWRLWVQLFISEINST